MLLMDYNLGFTVTFTGIFIVFMMLVFLVAVLSIFGLVSKMGNKKVKKVSVTETATEEKKPIVEAVNKDIDSEQVSPEIIAVISAAVATMYMGSSKKPVIKAVKRSETRPAWATAGVYKNTRAF